MDGNDARLVTLPEAVDASGSTAVYADDAVWVLRGGALLRIDKTGEELRVDPSTDVGDFAAVAVDGDRVLAAAASAAAVIPIDTASCRTLCEPEGCISVNGAQASPCDTAGGDPSSLNTETTNP